MQLFAFGLNYETAPLDECEAFALDEAAQEQLYERAARHTSAELILLSTCNRTEAFLYGTDVDVQTVRRLLAEEAGQPWPEAGDFMLKDEAAVRHALQLAGGMCSLVPGDNQILAQMKDAYRRAVEADTVDMVLHRFMHTAFRAAKRVATETDLSNGAASVSTAAVAMARDFFVEQAGTGLEGRRVLLVGAGQMGRLALAAMSKHAPAEIVVTNRSSARARAIAEHSDARIVPWAERHAAVGAVDLVLVATGAEDPVLAATPLPERGAEDLPVLVIDIAMPRNVESSVAERLGYVLYDLNALQAWIEDVEVRRRAELPRAEAICEDLLGEFVAWVFHQEALQPAIQAIRSTFESIRRQEIDRHAHRFSHVDHAELDKLTRSILQKVLAVPIVRLKNVEPESIDYVRGIRLLSTLFSRPDCEDDPEVEERVPVNAPAHYPFETHGSDREVELLKDALQGDEPRITDR